VPIHVGGHSEAAARRAGRLGDGFFPGTHDDLPHLVDVMRRAADEAGRDADAIEVTVTLPGTSDDAAIANIERLAEQGVARVVVPPLSFDPGLIADALSTYGERVIARF
jgi:alkanesulfonate monooxygenase SsuD/methylene tetrahydromethanopterin reductase-like flavin-dependent oxidoreductase (luciferase family)